MTEVTETWTTVLERVDTFWGYADIAWAIQPSGDDLPKWAREDHTLNARHLLTRIVFPHASCECDGMTDCHVALATIESVERTDDIPYLVDLKTRVAPCREGWADFTDGCDDALGKGRGTLAISAVLEGLFGVWNDWLVKGIILRPDQKLVDVITQALFVLKTRTDIEARDRDGYRTIPAFEVTPHCHDDIVSLFEFAEDEVLAGVNVDCGRDGCETYNVTGKDDWRRVVIDRADGRKAVVIAFDGLCPKHRDD